MACVLKLKLVIGVLALQNNKDFKKKHRKTVQPKID